MYEVDIVGWEVFGGKTQIPSADSSLFKFPNLVEFHIFHLHPWSLHGLIVTYRCWWPEDTPKLHFKPRLGWGKPYSLALQREESSCQNLPI